MTTKKIIINEFLTFLQNKIDTLDELTIVQICASNVTDPEVESGKNTLFTSISDDVRCITRKGEDKSKKNIKDCIKLLKETDPDNQPCFVARDLNRLPPVTFDHVDVTRLLKDLTFLKTEIQTLRLDSVSKDEISKLHGEMKQLRENCVRCTFSLSSNHNNSPAQVSQDKITKNAVSGKKCPNKSTNALVGGRPSDVEPVSPAARQDNCTPVRLPHTPSYRDIMIPNRLLSSKPMPVQSIACPIAVADKDQKDGFITVARKKRRPRNMRGTMERSSKLQVVESTAVIYVSRVEKSLGPNDIKDHIKDMGETCLSVELLKQYNETSFNSFSVKIPSSKVGTFLSGDFWPKGLVFRRFRERAIRNETSNNNNG